MSCRCVSVRVQVCVSSAKNFTVPEYQYMRLLSRHGERVGHACKFIFLRKVKINSIKRGSRAHPSPSRSHVTF